MDVVVSYADRSVRFGPSASPVSVGRGPGCDVVVDDGWVSRSHLMLRWDGSVWRVEDSSSRGTWVDGRRIREVVVSGPVVVVLGHPSVVLELVPVGSESSDVTVGSAGAGPQDLVGVGSAAAAAGGGVGDGAVGGGDGGSAAGRGGGRWWLAGLGVVVVLGLVGGLVVWSPWSSGGGDGGVAADDPGEDSFGVDVAVPTPVEFEEVIPELDEAVAEAEAEAEGGSGSVDPVVVAKAKVDAVVATAERAGLSVIAPASPLGAGLYGGSGVNACDVVGLKGFLAGDPVKAEAFARVQGIEVSEIGSFVDGLTAGFLLADTKVVNHGFKGGKEKPVEAVLKAGNAVLVDDQGVPRVRCKCGNPLKAAGVELDGKIVDPRVFADEVINARVGKTSYSDPSDALDKPNDNEVSLGTATAPCEFYIELGFVDNILVNGQGDDLRVIEVGAVEPTDVFVDQDGSWVKVGQIGGGDRSIDLSPAVPDGFETRAVRLCDVDDVDTSGSPGADIDAVATLNWRAP